MKSSPKLIQDQIVRALKDCAKELQLTDTQVETLNALTGCRSISQAAAKLNISQSALSNRLKFLRYAIHDSIKRIHNAQPIDKQRTLIDFALFSNRSRNALKGMVYPPVYWEDIAMMAYQLPSERHFGEKIYREICPIVNQHSSIEMPTWLKVRERNRK